MPHWKALVAALGALLLGCTDDSSPGPDADAAEHDEATTEAFVDESSADSDVVDHCGDGVVQYPEECDDGNDDDTDGCLSTCLDATCGDGFLRAGWEECDGDPPTPCSTTCATSGERHCTGCVWDDACTPPVEVCNEVDDDCDTTVDGAPLLCRAGETVACTTSCGTAGTGTCTAACEAPVVLACDPPTERCSNYRDDDCDTLEDCDDPDCAGVGWCPGP